MRSTTGAAGSHVGEELDFVLNFHLTKHLDLLTGYSYLWGGEFLRNTASATNAVDTSLFFLQASYRW
jgi:Alginate export